MGNLVVQENSSKALKSELIRSPVSQADAARFEKAMNAGTSKELSKHRPAHQVEVFIHDSRLKSYGSQFGHVSIAVGDQLYSMSHNGLYKTNVDDFIKRQQDFRDSVGFVLNATPDQAKIIADKMLEFDGTTYDLLTNSCTTTVTSSLEAAGIQATDPRFFSWSTTPTELITALQHSPYVIEVNKYDKE